MLENLNVKNEHSLMSESARAIDSTTKLLQLKAIQISENVVYLYTELWKEQEQAKEWMKNLYVYCRLTNGLQEGMTLYFKNIETKELLGFYQNNRATLHYTDNLK